jgi:hypothetical protein
MRQRKQRGTTVAKVEWGAKVADEAVEEKPFQEELGISGGCWAAIVHMLGKDQTQGAIIFAAGSVAYFAATYARPRSVKKSESGFLGVNTAAGWGPIVVAPVTFCCVFISLGLLANAAGPYHTSVVPPLVYFLIFLNWLAYRIGLVGPAYIFIDEGMLTTIV